MMAHGNRPSWAQELVRGDPVTAPEPPRPGAAVHIPIAVHLGQHLAEKVDVARELDGTPAAVPELGLGLLEQHLEQGVVGAFRPHHEPLLLRAHVDREAAPGDGAPLDAAVAAQRVVLLERARPRPVPRLALLGKARAVRRPRVGGALAGSAEGLASLPRLENQTPLRLSPCLVHICYGQSKFDCAKERENNFWTLDEIKNARQHSLNFSN